MRDLLTALAGAVILILVAALAVPPFVDWQAHRALVDRALSRSLGLPVRTDGRIEVRLLPSPRLRLDRLHLGGPDAGAAGDATTPALDARFVRAEVALAPLLKGEVRFTEARVGRAEIKLPLAGGGEGDALRLPADFGDALRGRDLAVEDLRVQQFLVTTRVPATGRTDQFRADDLRLQAPALVGPWRIEGTSGGVPFRAASGTPGADGQLPVKISGGGDAHPRFEADARLRLAPEGGAGKPGAVGVETVAVEAEGTARLAVGPPTQAAGAYLPFSLDGTFKARGGQVRFEGVELAVDPGGRALRLAGTGRLDLRQWRAGLALRARSLDLDAFLTSPEGRNLIARGPMRLGAGLPVMLDLDVAVEAAMLAGDDWSNLALAGTLDRAGGLLLRRVAATGPGGAALGASGQVEASPLRFTGPVSVEAADSEPLGRTLRRLGAEGPLAALLDGRRVEAAADLSAAADGLSLTNLRLGLGSARITGAARYTAPEAGARGRFEAQIRASGIDVAGLPPLGAALADLRDHDLALTLEARGVRFGRADTGNGTIAARVESDGRSLAIDSLDVTDLAGASANLSGRIGADGAGRVTGRLKAPAAAPLLGLLERVWLDEIRGLPAFLRAAPLDLAVTLDRDVVPALNGAAPDALRVQARGEAGGGTLDLTLASRDARVERAAATLAAPRAGRWFGRDDIPGLQQPARMRLSAERGEGGALALSGEATLAGLKLNTARPVVLGADAVPAAGEVRAETADLGPFLTLAGAARLAPGAWPAALTLTLSRVEGDAGADVAGRIAGAGVAGRLVRAPDGALRGSVTLDRLSLPQLAAALVIPPDDGGRGPRFAPAPAPGPPVAVEVRVASLDLGRGLTATEAGLGLSLDDGTLTVRGLSARLAGGRLSGSVAVARRGASATVSGEGALDDAALGALIDGSAMGGPLTGRLSADLRFAATADTAPGLAANPSGTGALTLKDLSVPEADPAAAGRALARAVEIDDPLREGRLKALVAEELSRGAAQERGSATAPATIVGGVLRAGPLDLDLGPARWSGTLAYDLRDGRLDARGALVGGAVPRGWAAGPPAVQLGLGGTASGPERTLDVGALSNGLAAYVLQRELEAIELNEADQVERQRRRGRAEMDRARAAALKAAQEKAAADKAAAEEAARQARARAADGEPETPVARP